MNKYALRQTMNQTPLAVTIASILAVSSAQAATIVVNTTADPGDASSCSLRSAVQAANTDSSVDGCDAGSGADEIIFDSNLAFSTITLADGEIEITGPLTIAGRVTDDPDGLIIDAAGASRIFNIQGSEPNDFEVGLNSLTLTKGQTVGSYENGGAVRADQANLHLEHVVVRNSSTGGFNASGGGVYVGEGTIEVVDSLISGNSTTGQSAFGGGLSVWGGNATLINSTVSNNWTTGVYAHGGGLHVQNGDAELTNSMVSGNSTMGSGSVGGGLSILGNAELTNSIVSDNSTMGNVSLGGGLFIQGGIAELTNSLISGNSTSGEEANGGGIYQSSGVCKLTDSTLSGNSTTGVGANGGGIHARSVVELSNSTVSGNATHNAKGGGLSFFYKGNVTLTHVTVADNMAGDGNDGIHQAGIGSTLKVNNSLIVQSGAGETACSQGATIHVNSLATDASCGVPVATSAEIALAPLADNGGPTFTHALNANSVAINAAGNCGDDFSITTDQRGQPRPGAGSDACDIGAFEFQILADAIFSDRFQAKPEPLIGQM